MTNGKFENKHEAEEHATTSVAMFWLKSAEDIIARGEHPAKLSLYVGELMRDELAAPAYSRMVRFLDRDELGKLAVQAALQRLHAGQFPTVSKYFSAKAEAPMVSVPPASPVLASHNLERAANDLKRPAEALSESGNVPAHSDLQSAIGELNTASDKVRDLERDWDAAKAVLASVMRQAGHGAGCAWLHHMHQVHCVPVGHKRLYAAKLAELRASAPACNCWRSEAAALLNVDPIAKDLLCVRKTPPPSRSVASAARLGRETPSGGR